MNTRLIALPTTWPRPITLGFLLWLASLLFYLPYSPFSLTHVQFLLLAAPLWLVPLGWRLMHVPTWVTTLALPAGASFAAAFILPSGIMAAIFTLPWLALVSALAFRKLWDWSWYRDLKLSTLCLLAASLYLPVGAAWGFADRLAWQPMDFSPTITLLTSIHFHYAGFMLPLITGLALREFPCLLGKMIGVGVIMGISLVAIGIMTTHFGLPAEIEIVAVTIMALSGMGAGMMHLNLTWRHRGEAGVWWWALAGLALIVGMGLALAYGWRTVWLIEVLTIPWMYAVHGTLNAIGFAIPGLLGWLSQEGPEID